MPGCPPAYVNYFYKVSADTKRSFQECRLLTIHSIREKMHSYLYTRGNIFITTKHTIPNVPNSNADSITSKIIQNDMKSIFERKYIE